MRAERNRESGGEQVVRGEGSEEESRVEREDMRGMRSSGDRGYGSGEKNGEKGNGGEEWSGI